MNLQLWIQAVANGLSMGGLYILIALGLTLLLSIMNILQLAHGEVYMLGAYVVYYLATSFGVNLYLAVALSIFLMAGFGLLLERALFRPCKKDWLAAVVVSIGLTLILQSGAVVAFGLFERSIPRLARGSLSLMNISIPKDRIIAMAIAAGFFAGLYLFLKRTKIGLAMVASAQNQEAASLRGIDPNVMSSLAMSIACGLAAAGGAMAGSILMLSPFMGVLPLVKGLTIIVVGGMGSLFGSVVGGIMLGLIDAMFPVFFGSVFCSIAPLILVILILILKPQGLFGHE